jgi:two-component system, cell cycle sensor histidine kinase and response regulator CckA
MPRILVVDDERGIRSLLILTLRKAGHAVFAASDAHEAMSLMAHAGPFDVLLSDVIMPVVDGHELVRRVMQRYPGTRCVLMSGFDNTDCQECPFALRCRVLQKPFAPRDALHLIEQVLKELPS